MSTANRLLNRIGSMGFFAYAVLAHRFASLPTTEAIYFLLLATFLGVASLYERISDD